MPNKSKSKLDRSDALILLISVICLIYAAWNYYHDETLTVSKRGITPVIDDETHFVVNFDMNSTLFSAHNDIFIKTTAWPYSDFLKKHTNDKFSKIDVIYIYFQGSTTKLDQMTDDGVTGPTFAMKKGADGRFHGGPYTISYQESGQKCVLLSTVELPFVPHYCENDNQPMLEISSSDSILQFKNNKITLALTWVVIAFTVITMRDPLRGIFRKYFDKNDNERNCE